MRMLFTYLFLWICFIFIIVLLYAAPIFSLAESLGQQPQFFSTDNSGYFDFLADSQTREQISNSLSSSSLACLFSTLIAFYVVYSVKMGDLKNSYLYYLPFFLPFLLGPLFSGLVLARVLSILGLDRGIMMGTLSLTTYCMPISLGILIVLFDKSVIQRIRIAKTLGARKFSLISKIIIPLLFPALLGSLIFSFLFSFNNVDAAIFAFGFESTIQSRMWGSLRNGFDISIYRLNSTVFLAFSLLSFIGAAISVMSFYNRSRRKP